MNSIVDEVRSGRNKSYYYRGPRASGKSVVLNLIGKKLVELGEEVYYISHAGFLRDLDLGPLKVADADRDRTKKIYFLVDEVHENTGDPSWGFLLKDSSLNLVVIGVGRPQLDGRSPAFAKKYPGTYLLVKQDDLAESVVNNFAHLYSAGAIADSDREVAKKTLYWALNYTGGHTYPFLKLAEYLLISHPKICLHERWSSIVCAGTFLSSELSSSIISRSFRLALEVKSAAAKIFYGEVDDTAEGVLIEAGLWNESNNWFISDFFQFILFSTRKKSKLTSVDVLTVEKVVEIGLSSMNETHFKPYDSLGKFINRYENSIGNYIGWSMAAIPEIYISPQHVITESSLGKKGAKPTVDFYINGELDTYIELVRDSSLLDDHFKRFDKGLNGKYGVCDNYIILDIVLTKDAPAKVAKEYENHHLTYVKSHNALYRGQKLIKSSVIASLPRTSPSYTNSRKISTSCVQRSYHIALSRSLLRFVRKIA